MAARATKTAFAATVLGCVREHQPMYGHQVMQRLHGPNDGSERWSSQYAQVKFELQTFVRDGVMQRTSLGYRLVESD